MADWQPEGFLAEKFAELHERLQQNTLMRRTPTHATLRRMLSIQKHGLGAVQATLDDIEMGIIRSKSMLERHHGETNEGDSDDDSKTSPDDVEGGTTTTSSPYIKITLRITSEILLYEQRSKTALLDSDEGRAVMEENERYDRILSGTDLARRTCDGEAQTINVLYKSRLVNTEIIHNATAGAYVSNFEMYDTYKDMLEQTTESVDAGQGHGKLEVTTYRIKGVDEFEHISQLPVFERALIMTLRILAGNVFEMQQRRFRNMIIPNPLAETVLYRYRLDELWRYQGPSQTNRRTAVHARSVVDISWCPCNSDICAVAYGMFSQPLDGSGAIPDFGCVCIWSIKNPVNPERCYEFEQPAMSVEFSPYAGQLLAIGLYDGLVEVRDIAVITSSSSSLVATNAQQIGNLGVSNSGEIDTDEEVLPSPPIVNYAPIVAIKWLPISACAGLVGGSGVEPLLALSRESTVIMYRFVTGPYMLPCPLLQLNRVTGILEGLKVERPFGTIQANRHPQGLDLCLDSIERNIFYVLTDEGCQHRCATNSFGQHLDVLQVAHNAACNGMHFSPWSPRLYLTYGNDWCIRIWLIGIQQPLITLKHGIGPVLSARWCPTHSTILVSNSGRTINVWDIRRSILRPMSTTSDSLSPYTLLKFSNCGRSLAAGNESGEVIMLALEDMPFPPHYQNNELEVAILKAIASDKNLLDLVRDIGHFNCAGKIGKRRERIMKKPKPKPKINTTETE